MEIEMHLNERDNTLKVKLLPCPSDFLFSIFDKIEILNMKRIDITVFNENENDDNDIYINTNNFIDVIGKIDTINVVADYLQKYDFDNYCIYKLIFKTENISVLYDDDSLLELEIKMENVDKTLNYAQLIINQYVSTIVNVENLGLLYH
jgi:hypothetical protein